MVNTLSLNWKRVFGGNKLLSSSIIPEMLLAVRRVTLMLVEQTDLAQVGMGFPLWQAQSTSGNTGQKPCAPFETLHSLWSWI